MNYERWQDLAYDMEEDLERYPLPICFEPREELKQLNLRKSIIDEIAQRWFRRYKK